jgi:hypothetical protein
MCQISPTIRFFSGESFHVIFSFPRMLLLLLVPASQAHQIRASGQGMDFIFLGENYRAEGTKFQAASISPRVHSLLMQNETLNSLVVQYHPKKLDERRIFEFIEKLLKGLPIDLFDSEIGGLLELATFLGDSKLIAEVLNITSAIDRTTVGSRLRSKAVVGGLVDEEVEFAASHFGELDASDLTGIDISVLERIISSKALRVPNEDTVLKFICSLDSEAQPAFLRYLRIEYLSGEAMEILLDRLPDSNLDPLIWNSLRRRLRLPVSLDNTGTPEKIKVSARAHCPMKATNPLDGIILYLSKKHKGNVHENGIVTITGNPSVGRDSSPLWYVTDLTTYRVNSEGVVNNPSILIDWEQGQWICWDFQEMRIRPDHYTLKCHGMRSWLVEGSLDGMNWTEIDRHTNSAVFKRWNTHLYAVSNVVEFRFIRLSQPVKRDRDQD